MFNVLFKKLVPIKEKTAHFDVLRFRSLVVSRSLTLSSAPVEDAQKHSFTVSYLVKSCGFPPEAAVSASHKLFIRNPDRANSVLTLLKSYGFTQTQISKVVRGRPSILVADPESTILPKLEFFHSIGVSAAELPKIICRNYVLLAVSLENQLIPYYNFLKSEVLLTDEEVVQVLKRAQRIFQSDVQKCIAPNITVLRELGVPQSIVSRLAICSPGILLFSPNKFNKLVKEVIDMGFSANQRKFIRGMAMFFMMSESTRESKFGVYRRWGWSEDEILSAAKRYPACMNTSEKKISSVMDFLVNKMGWKSSAVARYPLLFNYSLENRIVPRCSVITILQLKGFIKKKDMSFASFLNYPVNVFWDEFVSKYQDDVPELLNVYEGKIDLQELGFGYGDICRIRQFAEQVEQRTERRGAKERGCNLTIREVVGELWVQIVQFEHCATTMYNPNVEKLKLVFYTLNFVELNLVISSIHLGTPNLRSRGWLGDEIQSVFRRFPLCMTKSDKKIESVMDFLVDKMGWQSSAVARCPLKGFIKKDLPLGSFTILSDKKFLAEFVTKYQNNVPELLNVCHGKIGLPRLGFDVGDICQYQNNVPELLNVYHGKIGLPRLGFDAGDICQLRQL
ncbi:uncharacterized protein LOC131156056 [Malania oleifera]|uniref:uncharacterized protein LOC131156056 n=1 Tax=Malania oleifera TaxID=397392 RepID=UPI0025ADDE91|nr:uncharacterized protein LOC131156056 [Malania oleifera]